MEANGLTTKKWDSCDCPHCPIFACGGLEIDVFHMGVADGLLGDLDAQRAGGQHPQLLDARLVLSRADAVLSVILSAVVLLMFILLYPRIFAVTFDETFARATGTKAQLINSIIAVLTAVTVVIGMRMMGALLISSLIIFPALTAMRLCRSFKSVVICSSIVSVVCFIIGMAASYAFELPSGAAIVIVNIIAFAAFSFAALLKKRA